jgi:hypothetical protein
MRTADYDTTNDNGSLATQAKEKATEAVEQAKEKTQHATEQARGIVAEQLGQRSTEYGQKIKSQTEDLRSLSEQLRSQGKDMPAQWIDKAAEHAQRFGDYLESADANTLISDIENFARQKPWAIAAAAFGLGLLGSRVVKTSSEQRYTGYTGA